MEESWRSGLVRFLILVAGLDALAAAVAIAVIVARGDVALDAFGAVFAITGLVLLAVAAAPIVAAVNFSTRSENWWMASRMPDEHRHIVLDAMRPTGMRLSVVCLVAAIVPFVAGGALAG